MDRETFLNKAPFSVSQPEKEAEFQNYMKKLTQHHRKACKAYDDICNGVGDGPYLPVALFKDLELASVAEEKIIKRVTSSGTTGQKVSKIYLDAETSAAQQRALCMITGDFIGGDRIPMLIIDSPDVLRDRTKFSARGAGILGFSMMASKRYYALTTEMKPDWDSINEFCAKAAEGPTFAFGFTYMVWVYFYQALKEAGYGRKTCAGKPGMSLGLENCCLIHGGGWKKLQNQKVTDEEFRSGLADVCGIEKVADYYGMAEQTGSIFMECQSGHLHASIYSDIKVLNPEDFSECKTGEWGLLALESLLPESYPGHKLLTEDWGRILGEDDCPCGRKGRYFEIQGRIEKAEVRGCSDTFETATQKTVSGADDEAYLQVLAGTYPPDAEPLQAFDPIVLAFLDELSQLFTKNGTYRRYPEIYALGFWCRKSHIEQIIERQKAAISSNAGRGSKDISLKGRGLVLHVTPSNMPTMFTYSFITSTLAGNSNIVRLSQRESNISDMILEGICKILEKPEFEELKKRNAFVRFPRGHEALEKISGQAAARIIWGGDETVRTICSVPKADGCIDITFPDKYSIALIDANDINAADNEELKHIAHLFYNDTYGADQNACSSPRTIFWLNASPNALKKWWNAVAAEAANYDFQPWMATEKYRMLCLAYALDRTAGGTACEAVLEHVKSWGNRLYVIPCKTLPDRISDLEAKMGIFYEYELDSLDELFPYLGEKIQTVVSSSDQMQVLQQIRRAGCAGVDRVVHFGEALNFDTIWDRKDLIAMLLE